MKNILIVITLFFSITLLHDVSVFAENDTLKLGPSQVKSIQEVNTGEDSLWSSLVIFGAIGGAIITIISVYVIKIRK
ncbi:MAG: hypothetical protein ACYC6W_02750 [Nitrosotalea sp.]